MTDTIRALWDSIDKSPVDSRRDLFIGSLPVLSDAYREDGDEKRADFAAWLYRVFYTKNRGTGVKVRCVPAVYIRPLGTTTLRAAYLRPASYYNLCYRPDGPALWSVTGLQPYVWKKLNTKDRWLGPWPKKNVSACRLFHRLHVWVRPVLHLLTEATND